MKLEMVIGCINGSLTIDEKEEVNLTDSERIVITEKVCDWLKTHSELNQLLQYVLVNHGNYESLGECSQCGDFIDKYTLEI